MGWIIRLPFIYFKYIPFCYLFDFNRFEKMVDIVEDNVNESGSSPSANEEENQSRKRKTTKKQQQIEKSLLCLLRLNLVVVEVEKVIENRHMFGSTLKSCQKLILRIPMKLLSVCAFIVVMSSIVLLATGRVT
jgi:hypothetical protein